MPVNSRTVSYDELTCRRDQLLAELGMGWSDLVARRESGTMTADEWAAWEELDGINFLLGGSD